VNWYAIYTFPRAEKKVYAELVRNGITAYLPLLRTLRQWSDRKKWVEEPLFRSYIFVNISQSRYFDVLNTPGVVRYITFEGKAVPVPELQIEAIRFYLSNEDLTAEQTGIFLPGKMVEVVKGPMRGLRGDLIEVAGRHKVKVEISAIGQSIMVTIPFSHLSILD
jgi:transcription antitermination factor NusG